MKIMGLTLKLDFLGLSPVEVEEEDEGRLAVSPLPFSDYGGEVVRISIRIFLDPNKDLMGS